MKIHQINLQQHLGGGEIYAAFLCRALDKLGVASTLYIHPAAEFWPSLDLPASTLIKPCLSTEDVIHALPPAPQWILTHGPAPRSLRASHHLVCAIAHMPAFARREDEFLGHAMVFGVSQYVVDGWGSMNVPMWPTPLYGVASLRTHQVSAGPLKQSSIYDWDLRKVRDRLCSMLEPLWEPFMPRQVYSKRPGITLGIVSRLTTIKQFPALFAQLAPILAQHSNLNLEIFGGGGYASVRDLKHALQPIKQRVRFWGQQSNVTQAYGAIDFLLTGLPEKEALGLNVIEAQACGIPVLAVNAPPFTETVVEGKTGYLFIDPRLDSGADFSRLLSRLESAPRLDPRHASAEIGRFSFEAFVERLRPVVNWAQGKLPQA